MATPRLKEKYKIEIVAELGERARHREHQQRSASLEKIVVNMGVGEAASRLASCLMPPSNDLRIITGQQPCDHPRQEVHRTASKLREGQAIGCKVTLRGDRMWEFLDRLLVHGASPRPRLPRPVSRSSFDGRGNYTLGITEQLIFPEIEYDKIDRTRGMDITFVTTAEDDDECACALLSRFRLPVQEQVRQIGSHRAHSRNLGISPPKGCELQEARKKECMAKKSMIAKAKREPKFSTRRRTTAAPAAARPALCLSQVRPVPHLRARVG